MLTVVIDVEGESTLSVHNTETGRDSDHVF